MFQQALLQELVPLVLQLELELVELGLLVQEQELLKEVLG